MSMAQAYPYLYHGKQTTRQDKCRTAMPLDKPRIWLDLNEFVAYEGGEALYLFSGGDIVNDSDGNDVELYEGLEVSVFDNDLDGLNRPDAILADGVVVKNTLGYAPRVKWLVRLRKTNGRYRSGAEDVYWMSDLLP